MARQNIPLIYMYIYIYMLPAPGKSTFFCRLWWPDHVYIYIWYMMIYIYIYIFTYINGVKNLPGDWWNQSKITGPHPVDSFLDQYSWFRSIPEEGNTTNFRKIMVGGSSQLYSFSNYCRATPIYKPWMAIWKGSHNPKLGTYDHHGYQTTETNWDDPSCGW